MTRFITPASEQYGYWSEHPIYRVADWQHEVKEGNTRRGYWEWVECNADDDEGKPL